MLEATDLQICPPHKTRYYRSIPRIRRFCVAGDQNNTWSTPASKHWTAASGLRLEVQLPVCGTPAGFICRVYEMEYPVRPRLIEWTVEPCPWSS